MDTNNFIIFLDIDGVLVSYEELVYDEDQEHKFRLSSVLALNSIISYYNADLCIISSWNSKFKDEEHYKNFLISRGVIVNNLTFGDYDNRDGFIVGKINEGLKHYLIIDDEAYQYYASMPNIEYKRILQPNRYRCLDEHDVKQVTKNWKLNV